MLIFALAITFANKGYVIKNEKLNKFFGYLGSLSLPIYLFQSIIIGITYLIKNIDPWVTYFIVIFITVLFQKFINLFMI